MKNKIITKNDAITIIITALIITIISNLKINWYLKDIVIPDLIIFGSYYYILKKHKEKTNKKYLLLLIPILLILISNFIIEIDFSNKLLNAIFLPILLIFFFLYLTNKNFQIKGTSLKWILKLFPKKLFSNLSYLKFESANNNNKKIKSIIIGSIIGGVIGLGILSLLTSADAYFNSFIKAIIENMTIDINNLIILITVFIIIFSILINIIINKKTEMTTIKEHDIDKTILITILSIMNFIFILFIIAEVSKLTTNFLQLPKEYTYSSYAREGFFQLLIVTIINFSVIAFIEYKTLIKNKDKIIKNLISLLIILSMILILNSYYRMFLYIGAYGLTVLRSQVIIFLAMEIILFSILAKKVISGIKNDAYLYFIIITTTYILNLYICNDKIINIIMKLIK